MSEDEKAIERLAEIFREMVNGPDSSNTPTPQWAKDHAAFAHKKLRESGFVLRLP
jgi:hypothetical protein